MMPKPIAIFDVDLSRPLPVLTGLDGYASARVLVRVHGRPVGEVTVPLEQGGADPAALPTAIVDHLGAPIARLVRRVLLELPGMFAPRLYGHARGRDEYPWRLLAAEIAGTRAGPWALWQSRRRVRALGRSTPNGIKPERAGESPAIEPGTWAVPFPSPISKPIRAGFSRP